MLSRNKIIRVFRSRCPRKISMSFRDVKTNTFKITELITLLKLRYEKPLYLLQCM